jgi:hypothetical protein
MRCDDACIFNDVFVTVRSFVQRAPLSMSSDYSDELYTLLLRRIIPGCNIAECMHACVISGEQFLYEPYKNVDSSTNVLYITFKKIFLQFCRNRIVLCI